MGRSYRFMLRELGMFVPPSANRSYAARFSNRLVISGKAEGIAIRILEIARQMKLTSGRGSGRDRASVHVYGKVVDDWAEDPAGDGEDGHCARGHDPDSVQG